MLAFCDHLARGHPEKSHHDLLKMVGEKMIIHRDCVHGFQMKIVRLKKTKKMCRNAVPMCGHVVLVLYVNVHLNEDVCVKIGAQNLRSDFVVNVLGSCVFVVLFCRTNGKALTNFEYLRMIAGSQCSLCASCLHGLPHLRQT